MNCVGLGPVGLDKQTKCNMLILIQVIYCLSPEQVVFIQTSELLKINQNY